MSDTRSDDPFADLFGPRPAAPTGAVTSGGAAAPVPPETSSTPAAPGSRRAAREAAARQTPADGIPAASTPPTQGASPDPQGTTPAGRSTPAPSFDVAPGDDAATPAPAPAAAPASASSAATASFAATAAAAPTPRDPEPVRTAAMPVADEDWLFAADRPGGAPAMPYSRSAGARTADAEQVASSRAASTATLEDLFSGASSTDDIGAPPPPPDRRRRRIAGWVALGVILAILGGITAGVWYVWTTYEEQIREVMGWEEPKDYEAGLANGEAFVTIASGDTGSPISQKLYEAGVTKTPEAFYDYLIDNGENPPFVPGVFQLQKQMTSAAALEAILDPANKLENTVQLREGLTVEQSLPLLAEGLEIPLADFEAAVADPSAYGVEADSLEGWLFPATYPFEPGVTAQDVIARLVEQTRTELGNAGVPAELQQEILTEASIIQREVRFEDEMKKVARVIENRLDPSNQETFGLLQMDSTAQYGAGEVGLTASTSEAAQNDPNPWNTYVHPGLPIGPISNPGFAAIDAAMHPADGPWLYFVTVNMITGETVFTETYNEHLRYVDQMVDWCADNPGSGC
ncbi:endolytic transglycosylase MltG [Microbacterium hominis]|uniref:Endolytic murein transglycosylase n=1 Tax=Microbacterium hominis TaxID=162426 RepID=A0A7D4TQX6_9MICO|nr:endolytic transglycosylase MltG [Microbacterium hominis]QKJ19484.1 endolytic transglycosylase MltG [Microbacterium hominis]